MKRRDRFAPLVPVLLRVALGAAFLSAVASRLGLWGAHRATGEAFGAFVAYTGELNPWAPARLVPALAVAATMAETACGLALVAGVRTRTAARCSGALLCVFALTMTCFTGAKSALDYSVWSAAMGALLLASAPGAGAWGLDAWLARRTSPSTADTSVDEANGERERREHCDGDQGHDDEARHEIRIN